MPSWLRMAAAFAWRVLVVAAALLTLGARFPLRGRRDSPPGRRNDRGVVCDACAVANQKRALAASGDMVDDCGQPPGSGRCGLVSRP